MNLLLNHLRAANKLALEVKEQLIKGETEEERHLIDNKMIAAQVYIQFALDEMEFKEKVKQKIKWEFSWMFLFVAFTLSILLVMHK